MALGYPQLDDKHNAIKVSQEMAFTAFVAIGPAAELQDLIPLLEELYGAAPSLRQLKDWEKHYSWKKRRENHYDQLKTQVAGILGETPERLANSVEYLESIKGSLLQLVHEMVTGKGDGTTPRLKLKGNIAELKAMMSIVVEASTHIELLSGNPTAITENRQILGDIDDATLLRRFGKYVDAKVIEHGPADPGTDQPRQIAHDEGIVPEELH